jgi:hypothetical protein
MKLVREHINEFKQGQNPYKTMEIGSNRPYAEGDNLICIESMYMPTGKDWILTKRAMPGIFKGNKKYKITYIDSTLRSDKAKKYGISPNGIVRWFFSEEELNKLFKRI